MRTTLLLAFLLLVSAAAEASNCPGTSIAVGNPSALATCLCEIIEGSPTAQPAVPSCIRDTTTRSRATRMKNAGCITTATKSQIADYLVDSGDIKPLQGVTAEQLKAAAVKKLCDEPGWLVAGFLNAPDCMFFKAEYSPMLSFVAYGNWLKKMVTTEETTHAAQAHDSTFLGGLSSTERSIYKELDANQVALDSGVHWLKTTTLSPAAKAQLCNAIGFYQGQLQSYYTKACRIASPSSKLTQCKQLAKKSLDDAATAKTQAGC